MPSGFLLGRIRKMEDTFHARLKELLKKRGLTQKEFARQCGLTEGQLSHYLSGYRMPRSDILERIAKTLDVSIEILLPTSSGKTSFENAKSAIMAAKPYLNPEEKMALILLLSKND